MKKTYFCIFILLLSISNVKALTADLVNGSYQLSNGVTYGTCTEYKKMLGENAINGYYHDPSSPTGRMYCQMDATFWNLKKEYQLIIRRMDGSFDFTQGTWAQMKQFRGNDNEFWIGLEELHRKCGSAGSCEAALMLQENTGEIHHYTIDDYYIEDEAAEYRLHMTGWTSTTKRATFVGDNQRFTTKDNDNDTHSASNCAVSYNAPGYYTACHNINFFGEWNQSAYAKAQCHFLKTKGDDYCNIMQFMGLGIRPKTPPHPTYGPVLSGNGKYQLTDGTKYKTCQEYYDILGEEYALTGFYEEKDNSTAKMFCQMTTARWNKGHELCKSGYQLMFRRMDGSTDFYAQTWNTWKQPFGTDTEFWMGFEDLHAKCGAPETCEMIVLLTERDTGKNHHFLINDFYIENEANKWRIHLQGETDAKNYFQICHDGAQFSTIDQDNDTYSASCATQYGGAMWFTSCHCLNPFGDFSVASGTLSVCMKLIDSVSGFQTTMQYFSMGFRQKEPSKPVLNNGKYEMANGTRYSNCQEYKDALGKNAALNGYYHDLADDTAEMYCQMDVSDWNIPDTCDSSYQLIFRRTYGDLDFSTIPYNTLINPVVNTDRQEMWMGLEHLHKKCPTAGSCEMVSLMYRKDVLTQEYIKFDDFYIQDASTEYIMTHDGYSGTSKNSMLQDIQSGSAFTTFDNDNDSSTSNCATSYNGPMWYNRCHVISPLSAYDQANQFGISVNQGIVGIQTTYRNYRTMMWGIKRKCRGSAGMPGSRISQRPTLVEVSGKYELSDGSKFDTCEEYRHVMGRDALEGFYAEASTNERMYCLFRDQYTYGLNGDYQVILKRSDGSINDWKDRTWAEMKGTLGTTAEYWIGLDNLHRKCGKANTCELAMMMNEPAQDKRYVHYNDFYVEDEANNFRIHFTGVTHTVNDPANLEYHNGREFTTIDRDNDTHNSLNCASSFGPFWFDACHNMNVFGDYFATGTAGVCYDLVSSACQNMENMIFAFRLKNQSLITMPDTEKYCICPDGFYDDGTDECKPCSYQCATCVTSATNCITCSDESRITPPSCGCKSGYYESGVSLCNLCQGKCATCSDGSSCDTCAHSHYIQPACDCTFSIQSGEFISDNFDINDKANITGLNNKTVADQSREQCRALCAAESTFTCRSIDYVPDTRACNLSENYPGDGVATVNDPWPTVDLYIRTAIAACNCNYPCASCSSTLTNCETCSDVNRDLAQNCDCKPGFVDTGVALCTPCEYQCSTCQTNAATCVTCSDVNRDQASSCDCKPGYFDTGVATCSQCSYPCATCSGTATNCLTCKTTANRVSVTDCSCQSGYVDNLTECEICHYTCATCSTDATTCDTCSDAINRDQAQNCICKPGFYDNSVANCAQCVYKCATCQTSSTNCLTCSDANRDVNNSCQCKPGFYDDGTATCQGCSYPCENCQTSATNCLTCKTTANRISVTDCGCKPGFYETGSACAACNYPCQNCETNADNCLSCKTTANRVSATNCNCQSGYVDNLTECEICHYTCATCSTDSTTCDTCSDAINRDQAQNCICKPGYYDNSVANCAQCDYKCATCQTSSTNCLTCSDVNRDVNNSCQCKPGFYDDGTATCQACSYPCGNCQTSATNCLTCKTTANRISVTDCGCQDGFYETGSACAACNYPCGNCVTNADNCLSCKNTANRVSITNCDCQSGYIDNGASCSTCAYKCDTCSTAFDVCDTCSDVNRDQGNNCTCKNGYVDTGVEICSTCDYKCATCQTSVTNCLTCSDVNRDVNNSCQCKPGFYDDGTATCQACSYPCGNCQTSATNCLTCKTTANRISVTDCGCQDGFYETGSACAACNYPCGNCETNADNCLSCKTTANRVSATDCSCDSGYVDNNTSCEQCHYSCSTCSTNSTTCDTCSDANRDQANNCACKPGFIDSGVAQCSTCDYQCQTCQNSTSDCLTCSDVNRDVNSSCDCKPGFFDENVATCGTCNYPCQTCSNDADTCDSCVTQQHREADCSCSAGYFDDNSECVQCQYPCKTCSGAATSCDSCENPSNRVSQNDCSCQGGYFDDSTKCVKCSYPCDECSDQNTCITCSTTDFRTSITDCTCQDKYFDNGNECQACSHPCDTCSDENTCLTCSSTGLGRTQQLPDCGCQDGYYSEKGQIHCQICDSQCLTCSSKNKCDTCLNPDARTPKCEQPKRGFFAVVDSNDPDNFGTCAKQCETCSNSSDNCDTCKNELNRQNNPPQCSCSEGFYDDKNVEGCIPCPEQCSSCTDFEGQVQCLECQEGLNRELNEFNLVCDCMEGYKENRFGDLLCHRCYYYKGECLLECPDSTEINEEKYTCIDISYEEEQHLFYFILGGVLVSLTLISSHFLKSYMVKKKFQNQAKMQQIQQNADKDSEDAEDNEISVIKVI